MTQAQADYRNKMLALAREWRESGASARVFAQEHGVTTWTLYYWRQRVVGARRQLLLPVSDNYFCRRRVSKGVSATTGGTRLLSSAGWWPYLIRFTAAAVSTRPAVPAAKADRSAGASCPPVPQREPDLAVAGPVQPFLRERRPRCTQTQPLHLIAQAVGVGERRPIRGLPETRARGTALMRTILPQPAGVRTGSQRELGVVLQAENVAKFSRQ